MINQKWSNAPLMPPMKNCRPQSLVTTKDTRQLSGWWTSCIFLDEGMISSIWSENSFSLYWEMFNSSTLILLGFRGLRPGVWFFAGMLSQHSYGIFKCYLCMVHFHLSVVCYELPCCLWNNCILVEVSKESWFEWFS